MKPPLCFHCQRRPSVRLLTVGTDPVGDVCAVCEFALMRRLRSEIGGEEGREGWARFIAARGYRDANTYEDAIR